MNFASIVERSRVGRASMQVGEARALRRVILKRGQIKFGPPTPEQAMALGGIDDIPQLDRMFDRIARVKSWASVLRTR